MYIDHGTSGGTKEKVEWFVQKEVQMVFLMEPSKNIKRRKLRSKTLFGVEETKKSMFS